MGPGLTALIKKCERCDGRGYTAYPVTRAMLPQPGVQLDPLSLELGAVDKAQVKVQCPSCRGKGEVEFIE